MGLNLSMFFYHLADNNRVVIEVKIQGMPDLKLDMTPANFFRLADAVVTAAVPFIEKVKANIGDVKGEDIKVDFNTNEWEQKM